MPPVTPTHDEVLDAIKDCEIFTELVKEKDGKFIHESDVETIVYGRQYAGGKQIPPYAQLRKFDPGIEIIREGQSGRNTFYVLLEGKLDVEFHDPDKNKREVSPAKPIFGEMSLFSGQSSSATVKVVEKAKILEFSRPALRLLRKFERFNALLDASYREHSLDQMLQELKKKPSSELQEQLENVAQFKLHAYGHTLFEEGDRIEHLILIRRGWVQRARSLDSKKRLNRSEASDPKLAAKLKSDSNLGLDFLGDGNWLGLEAITEGVNKWRFTATCMARTEVLEIAISDLKDNSELVKIMNEDFPNYSNRDDEPPEHPPSIEIMQAAAIEITEGIIDGTNLLVMDMDKCVRCGNCSLACHRVHGQSRLVRHGIHIERPKPESKHSQHVLAPSVCLHCHDAECLTGCPTGAIERISKGQIDIEPDACIGCGDCATQCPYNAISLVPKKQSKLGIRSALKSWISLTPQAHFPDTKDTRDLLAVKCDLCKDARLNSNKAKRPAYSCQENCPTGALLRIDPKEYFSEANEAIGIRFLDKTHAFGRNIHHEDPLAKRFHVVGAVLAILITAAMLWAAAWYKLDGHFNGTWVTMRWITGVIGLASMAVALTYSGRKQVYRRRAGPLRYWMIVHIYMGVIAGSALLIHGGRDTRGLLTSLLMIAFDLTIVTGLFGIGCYYLVPRLMTRIEEEPLLIEDLRRRGDELREELKFIDTGAPNLHRLVKEKMRKRFLSFRYLVRQFYKHEKLEDLIADAFREFKEDCDELKSPDLRKSLKKAVETTVTLRRVDSLIYLHQVLRFWLAPHVVFASLMMALMVVHIIQVFHFTVR